jgi:hypothetical protein
MSSAPQLWLFKGSRRALYRQQNLHLLAAERGTIVDVSWNRSWVAPELFEANSIDAGVRACFVLTDQPYLLFVPVREGTVVDARWDDTSLRLRVALGTWVRPAGGDCEAFTRALRDAQPAAVPGERFVALAALDPAPAPAFDEKEDAGWRGAIDDVLTLASVSEETGYREAVFFRVAGVRDERGMHPARESVRGAADSELVLRFHNPHLDDGVLRTHQLRVSAGEGLRVRGGRTIVREGEVALPLSWTGAAAELSLSVAPDPARHTQLTLRFGGAHAAPHGGLPAQAGAAALRRLWDVVARTLQAEPAAEMAVLDAFEAVLPGEQRVQERRALLLAGMGQETAAFELLRSLDPELMEDAARFLLFRLTARRGAVGAAADLVARLDLTAEARLRLLLTELDGIEPPVLDRLVRELMARVPDEADQHAIVEHVAGRLTSPQLIAEIGQRLYLSTGDAQGAYAFIEERRRALRESSPEMSDALIELARAGAQGADLSDVVGHRIGNLIGRGEVEEALARLRQVRHSLAREERDRLHHRAADLLIARDRSDEAAGLLGELAQRALETGDVDAAGDAAERALGVAAAAGRPAPEWIRAIAARVTRALQEMEGLREWRTAERELRAERLRSLFLNRRILIVGGLRRAGMQERLETVTGAGVDFGESFRGESDDLDALAARIRQGRYAAVVFRWQLAGHDVSDALKSVCEQAGVPFLYAKGGGVFGVEEALAELAARQP